MNEVSGLGGTSSESMAPQETKTVSMTFLDLLILLYNHRRFVLYSAGLCGFVAVIIAFVIPLTYTAETKLMPPQQNSSFSSTLLSQLGGLGSLAGAGSLSALKSPNDLFVGLLKSNAVEDAMIERFHLEKDYKVRRLSEARKALEKHVSVDGSEKDGLIRITVSSNSPERAAELANGYVEEYRKLSESLAIGEAAQRRLFLERQLQQTKDKLASAEEDLKRTEQTTGMIQLDSQARALIESAGSLRAQVVAKEVQVQSMRTYAGPGNTQLVEAEQELAGLKAQLAKLGGQGSMGDSDLVPSKGQLPQAGLDYVRKLREVKYNETIFDILARQYEAAKLDEAKEGATVQVVDFAKVPDKKSGPPRMLIVIGGTVLGFLGAIAWITLQEALRVFRQDPESARKLAALGI